MFLIQSYHPSIIHSVIRNILVYDFQLSLGEVERYSAVIIRNSHHNYWKMERRYYWVNCVVLENRHVLQDYFLRP